MDRDRRSSPDHKKRVRSRHSPDSCPSSKKLTQYGSLSERSYQNKSHKGDGGRSRKPEFGPHSREDRREKSRQSVHVTSFREERRRSSFTSTKYENARATSSIEHAAHSTFNSTFSFRDYKRDINRIFTRHHLIQDIDDFWKFISKFEAVMKTKGECLSHPEMQDGKLTLNELGLPASFDRHHLINIDLSIKNGEILSYMTPRDEEEGDSCLSSSEVQELRKVLQYYLGFKQKENFKKLVKLRESQANLPVAQHRNDIVQAVTDKQVVIIAGDTGCGKSTQVPQYLLKAGFSRIACTQPRRIACISLSKRVAFETLNEYGSQVGYQIRFERKKDLQTRILFITEGLLLRQVSSDNSLINYDILVLDEVHERHLHGDFLLGVVKCLLYQRKDLKVVLMSATINIKLFSDYFGKEAKVIQVPGRLHPITLQYHPLSVEDRSAKSERFNAMPYLRILQLIDSKYSSEERGDVLIFLSGMTEIQSVVDVVKEYNLQKKSWIILPLHSTLSLAEQDKVFDYAPDGVRKCVIATNIAETSITIDGIRFVVDSGKVKEMSYDSVCKMQRLKEFWISKASAEQRKGRAGRTGPGVCFRLYSEEEYQTMEKYTTPELQRVPLDALLLQMVSMGLPDARKFPFIEPPPPESIENGITSLKQQCALTPDEKLTSIGKLLAQLPVDIPLGKMLIMGSLFHQVQPVLSLAAALSVQTPFTNRAYRDPECENARKSLESDHGDPITLLNAFREWLEEKNRARGNDRSTTRMWCKRRGLEEQRFYEMTKLRAQFKDLLQACGLLKEVDSNDNMTSRERAMRHGELKLLRTMKREYQNAAPRRRTLLKADPFDVCNDEGKEQGVDIKDVEFRMRNDSSQVQSLLTGSSACSYKDLTMLKVILCSGLYPQFAIADEFNYCKTSSEQLFHTQQKPYVALHPMSYFGNNHKILTLEESDIVHVEGIKHKSPFSAKHQLLCYMSLLETTKPYLVNTMRMPAAQTLLLFCQKLHTNSNLSRIVCDSWLQLEFPHPQAAEVLVLKAAKIHNLWENLLQLRLENQENPKVEQALTEQLVSFMRTDVVYSMRRLLAADLKVLYVGNGYNDGPIDPNPFQKEFEAVQSMDTGGMQVSSRITFNCLLETDAEAAVIETETSIPWHCENCGMTCCLSTIERLQHQIICYKVETEEHHTEKTENHGPSTHKSNVKAYNCENCHETLYLTPIEILKHKKQHK